MKCSGNHYSWNALSGCMNHRNIPANSISDARAKRGRVKWLCCMCCLHSLYSLCSVCLGEWLHIYKHTHTNKHFVLHVSVLCLVQLVNSFSFPTYLWKVQQNIICKEANAQLCIQQAVISYHCFGSKIRGLSFY